MISLKMGGIIVAAFIAGAFISSPELRAYAANTVGSADIINESIQSEDIKNGQVKAADIATGAVTRAKIASNAIDASKIAENAVGAGEIVDGGITAVDVHSSFISGGAKADSQDGWFPTCSDTDCQGRIRMQIFNVPNARDGSVIMVTVNDGDKGANSAVCAVTDVLTESFMVTCDRNPKEGAFLDYIVINRPGI